jgi:hypothetical protein
MEKRLSDEEIYQEASKRVKAKKDFYVHLAVYLVVNAFLVIIWAYPAGGGYHWFIFPLGGWGIGLIFHALDVFFFSRRVDRAAIEKEAEKIRRDQGQGPGS